MYRAPLGALVLTESDLEINVLEFRQRSFQFERLAEVGGQSVAVFSRTETESESQFRPRLVHLRLIVPQAWVVHDEANDVLMLARDGTTIPLRLTEMVVEVGAEPAEFKEQGIAWNRVAGPSDTLLYAPAELKEALLAPPALAALGIV
jgi:hypothetical protein